MDADDEPRDDILPINFTISDAANVALERLEQKFNEGFPEDPAAVLGFGWGYMLGTSPDTGNVAIGFHCESQVKEIEPLIQGAFGRKVVFFTTEAHHHRFEGKVLDVDDEGRFYLRSP